EPSRLLGGQICWLCALENLVHEVGGPSVVAGERRPVTHQAPRFDILGMPVYGWQTVLCSQFCEPRAVQGGEAIREHQQAVGMRHGVKGAFEFIGVLYLQRLEIDAQSPHFSQRSSRNASQHWSDSKGQPNGRLWEQCRSGAALVWRLCPGLHRTLSQ